MQHFGINRSLQQPCGKSVRDAVSSRWWHGSCSFWNCCGSLSPACTQEWGREGQNPLAVYMEPRILLCAAPRAPGEWEYKPFYERCFLFPSSSIKWNQLNPLYWMGLDCSFALRHLSKDLFFMWVSYGMKYL